MRYFFFISFLFLSISCSCQHALVRRILIDDFGGYQFDNELYETILLAKSNKIKKIEFNITETFDTKKESIYSPNIDKTKNQLTKIICEFQKNGILKMTKKYNNGNLCYVAGYNFEIIKGVFLLKSKFRYDDSYPNIDSTCKDLNYSFHNNSKNIDIISENLDTTIITCINYDYKTLSYGLQVDTILVYSDTTKFYISKDDLIRRIDNETYSYLNKGDTSIMEMFVPTDYGNVKLTTSYYFSSIPNSNNKIKTIETIEHQSYTINNPEINNLQEKNNTYKSVVELCYTFDKRNFPVKIEVLNSSESFINKGSTISINYWK